jgi:hypothetical protein
VALLGRFSTVRALRSTVRDLPDMTVGIGEARGPDSPRAIHRSIQQGDAARGEFGAGLIDVIDANRELKPRSGVGGRDLRGSNEIGRLRAHQKIDHEVVEIHDGGVFIFVDRRKIEDVMVEVFARCTSSTKRVMTSTLVSHDSISQPRFVL